MSAEAFEILSKEHEHILKVADALESEIGQLSNKDIDAVFFKEVISFIRDYADKFHHAKEEDILFKEFNKCAEEGYVHCNPVGQMLFEHDEGRKNVKMMESGLNEKSKDKLIKGANGYIQLIREHIFKEDSILYPMADEALSKEVKKTMLGRFEKINTAKKKEVERFEKFAGGMAKR